MPRLGVPWATGLAPSINGMLIEFLFFPYNPKQNYTHLHMVNIYVDMSSQSANTRLILYDFQFWFKEQYITEYPKREQITQHYTRLQPTFFTLYMSFILQPLKYVCNNQPHSLGT